MFWFSCLQNTKQLSMPRLSANKRGVTTQRTGKHIQPSIIIDHRPTTSHPNTFLNE